MTSRRTFVAVFCYVGSVGRSVPCGEQRQKIIDGFCWRIYLSLRTGSLARMREKKNRRAKRAERGLEKLAREASRAWPGERAVRGRLSLGPALLASLAYVALASLAISALKNFTGEPVRRLNLSLPPNQTGHDP